MSADNSVAYGGSEVDQPPGRSGFEIPPELATRYEVRAVETAGGEQRLGLFRPVDRDIPAIEITNDRMIARSEDAETVASLVKIAQHNGWDRIDVAGSSEFRKAVWTAATREGLAVSGYEPSFAEQERIAKVRQDAAPRRERESVEQPLPAAQPDAGDAPRLARSSDAGQGQPTSDRPVDGAAPDLSDGDRRLLLTLSRHTEDRKALVEGLGTNLDTFQREVQYERIDANREALGGALERVLDSPTLVNAFERSGYEPDALRQMGKGGEWDGEVADAIYLVRSNLHRDTLSKGTAGVAALVDEIESVREERAVATPTRAEELVEREPVRRGQERDGAAGGPAESEDLANLFLNGAAESLAAEPRLATALQAQTAMEQHIGEVFEGDPNRMASANLESRQLISDALRRGLDVSVREPTPIRQIEPVQMRPDLER